MPEDREWSWVGEDGVVHGLSEDELTFALSSEEVPAYTLVSHRTWSEWLPAMQVAELVWALPSGHADSPRKAELLERSGPRRAPQLDDYPALKARFDDIRLGRVDPKAEAPLVAKSVATARTTSELDLGSVVDAELEAVFDNIDALGGDSSPPAEGDLPNRANVSEAAANVRVSARPRDPPRPVVPRAPRGRLPSFEDSPPSAPRGKLPSSSSLGPPPPPRRELESDGSLGANAIRRPPVLDRRVEASPESGGRSVPTPDLGTPRSPEPPSVSPASESERGRPSFGSSPDLPPLGSRPPPPRLPAPSSPDFSALAALGTSTELSPPFAPAPSPSANGEAAEAAGRSTPPLPSQPPPSPHSVQPDLGWRPSLPQAPPSDGVDGFGRGKRGAGRWVVGGGVVLALALAGGLAVHLRGEEAAPVVPTQAAPPPPPPPKQLVSRCRVELQPTRVFDFAKPDVKPVWGEPSGAARIPLGFAQTSRLALGVDVTVANLATTVVDRQDDPSPMLSVVPHSASGKQEFLVERAASRLQTARAVSAKEPFTIGLRGKTIAARLGKPDHDLWPSPWETLSVPEVARIDARSHAVAIRGGGQRGAVLVGKVGENSQPIGELEKLEVPVPKLGEPSLSVSQGRVWIAIDGGPTNELGQLLVGSKPVPGVPTRAEIVPDGGNHVSAPSAVGLPHGHVFVQWTLGPVGKQSIVGRVFTSELKSRGELLTLSPAGADAHHGVTAFVGDRVLTVYFVRLPNNNHELWASATSCSVAEE